MLWTLPMARSISCRMLVSVALPPPVEDPWTLQRPWSYEVAAIRPSLLRIALEGQSASHEDEPALSPMPFDIYVSDGVRQLEVSRSRGRYVLGPAAGQLAELRSTKGLTQMFGVDLIFAPEPERVAAVQEHGASGDAAVVRLVRSTSSVEPTYHVLLVSTVTGLPLRSSYQGGTGDASVEYLRVDYADWAIDPVLPGELFSTDPPAGFIDDTKA